MAEQTVGENSPGAPDTGGLAMDMAMEEARADPSLKDDVAAFLRDQRDLILIQKHQLKKQFRLTQWEKGLSVLLRGATAVVGIAFAGALGFMIWEASRSNGLLIEPFAVPPDMASRGLSGQVVAGQLLAKLTAMDNMTLSYRAPQSYANNWGNDIKVEIPQTGVSIGELRRFLREWLGNDNHISGEVWRTDSGIAISVRTTGEGGASFTGAPTEIDALVQKAAEHVFHETQPYRYANYIRGQRRFDEAHAIYLRLTNSPSVVERGWAWYGIGVLSNNYNFRPNYPVALWSYRKAVSVYPDLTIAYSGIAGVERTLGHTEAVLHAERKTEQLLSRSSIPDIAPRSLDYVRLQWTQQIPVAEGDYVEAVRKARQGAAMPDQQGFRNSFRNTVARSLANQHDEAAARAAFRELPAPRTQNAKLQAAVTPTAIEASLENWHSVLETESTAEQTFAECTKPLTPVQCQMVSQTVIGTQLRPWAALAKAKLGDVAEAQALIAATPADCYDCARTRGTIAALANKPGESDAWFARAVHDGPSLPFAHNDWGKALLARGQPDAAIEKFKLSNQKGPKFADPLEGWGEALMAKNQSHLALAKFTEAEKYAPKWGRLHLKWGEALTYAGKRDEAKKQFSIAARLHLTPSEKAELGKMNP